MTVTTIAWKVARYRKANQPIKAGDPLSCTPVTISKYTTITDSSTLTFS